ncbi:SRPBCC domain-containing protein [Phenylobacterium sp.]|uniref:SRPBCC family protein n=1 Tax=Phenylobacterium sp. TaxID=1871053 RepID=UPI0035620D64
MADAATTLGAGHEVTLTRTFKAPAALVFDCFVDPGRFARWWGPLGCQNEILKLDARPGGEISLRMFGPGFDHVMGGEFLEIAPPKRIVFLTKAFEAPGGGWGIVNRNTVTLEDLGASTRLTLHTLVETAAGELVLGALGGMKTGWGQSFERLGDLVGGGGKLDLQIADRRIVLTRAFDAPPEQVWRALTDPQAFAKWWNAGGCEVETFDVRPGGKWSVRQAAPDGSVHRFFGEYRTVEPPTRLAMTQGFDAYAPIEVVFELTEDWGRTTLTRTMTFPDNQYRDGMAQSGLEPGAAASYDALAALLAAG